MARSLQPNSPDEQRHEIYCAIGEAITAWGLVEDRLGVFFSYFTVGDGNAMRTLPAMAAFHSVVNFRAKLEMTTSAAEFRLSGEQLDRWKKLAERVGKHAKNRHQIAHFSLIQHGPFPNGPMRFYLSPSLLNVQAHLTGKEPPRLSGADVRQRAKGFRSLVKELNEFAMDVGAIPATLKGQFEEFFRPLVKHFGERGVGIGLQALGMKSPDDSEPNQG